MNEKSFLKQLSYHPSIIFMGRLLHLNYIFKNWYYDWSKPANGLLSVSINGIDVKFYVKNPDELRFLESLDQDHSEKKLLERIAGMIKPGQTVYDIGAHIGLHTLVFSKIVGAAGKVVAFEPEKTIFNELQLNMAVNNAHNVTVYDDALGNENFEGRLHISKTIGNATLAKSFTKIIDSQRVMVAKGDEFVKNHNLPIPAFVKIDVEGYEYFVIAGLAQTLSDSRCKIVCCEIHPTLFPPDVTTEMIFAMIKKLGFKRIETVHKRKQTFNILCYKDNRPND